MIQTHEKQILKRCLTKKLEKNSKRNEKNWSKSEMFFLPKSLVFSRGFQKDEIFQFLSVFPRFSKSSFIMRKICQIFTTTKFDGVPGGCTYHIFSGVSYPTT